MKKMSFIITFMIALQGIVSAQKIIINPSLGSVSTSSINIDKIVLGDTSTILWFKAIYAPKRTINIDTNSYIRLTGGEKLSMKATIGLEVGCDKSWIMPDSGIRHYALVYPPLPTKVKKFDFIENENSDWKIYDIALETKKHILPETLMGNWLENNKTNKWIVGLYDSVVIYDQKIWHYNKISKEKSDYKISLIANKSTTIIYIHRDTLGHCFVGTNPSNQIECTLLMKALNEHKSTLTDNSFPQPFYQNGIATIKGFVNGYCAKSLIKKPFPTNSVYGVGMSMDLKTNDDGTFEMKIPIVHAGRYTFQLPRINKFSYEQATIYLEVGKETLCYFDLNDTYTKDSIQKLKPKTLFMGDNSEVNTELTLVEKLPKPNKKNNSLFDSTDNYGITKYQEHTLNEKKMGDVAVFSLMELNDISQKTATILKAENKVNQAFELLRTNSIREASYKYDHHVKSNDYKTKYLTPLTLGFPYLNPVKEVLQDTFCQVSKSFLGVLGSINIMEEIKKPDFSFKAMMDRLISKGIVFTSDEKLLYNRMSMMKKPESTDIDSTEFYKKVSADFGKKYKDSIAMFYKDIKLSAITEPSRKYFDAPPFITDLFTLEVSLLQIGMQKQSYDSANLKKFTESFSIPAFSEYLTDFNKNATTPIISNAGSVVRDLPLSKDSVFDAIVSRYKGKVIYLDFWETWCMPCRMGMETIAPLKEELKDSNVVFVCIASESSPIETWKSLNKGIRAEHFRLSSEQYASLNRMFTIETIPRYVLIDKEGKVVNKNVGQKTNDEIRKLLLTQVHEKN